MKKRSLFWIIVISIVFILLVNFLFHIFYFKAFSQNIRLASDLERDSVLVIMEREFNLSECRVEVLDVYVTKRKELVQVDLIKGDDKKHYLVDLEKDRIVRK